MAKKNIILCGFMGCGKSTIGSLLAKRSGMAFIDLDAYIEKKEGRSISDMFRDDGEDYFREKEREAVKELSMKKGLVIAAGGGTLTFAENVEPLKRNGTIVLLDIPVEVVTERLKNDTVRPLLARPDRDRAIRELYAEREPLYRAAADISVDAARSPMQICMEIISRV